MILTEHLIQMLDREGEIGIREGFVLQGEVPPLGIDGLEAVTEHGLTQNHTVFELLGGDAAFRFGRTLRIIARVLTRLRIAAEVGVALGTEPVEGAAHIQLFLCRHVEERQVNGRAACMSAFLSDVTLRKEHVLVEVGIEVGLHQRVGDVLCPAHEVVNALLRTIGIVDFQAIAQLDDIVAYGLQAIGSLAGDECRRLLVAINTFTHEVISTEISDFQYGIGHHVSNGHELAGIVGHTDYRAFLRVSGADRCTFLCFRKASHHRQHADGDGGSIRMFLLYHILEFSPDTGEGHALLADTKFNEGTEVLCTSLNAEG